jgi:hypothetical protein
MVYVFVPWNCSNENEKNYCNFSERLPKIVQVCASFFYPILVKFTCLPNEKFILCYTSPQESLKNIEKRAGVLFSFSSRAHQVANKKATLSLFVSKKLAENGVSSEGVQPHTG